MEFYKLEKAIRYDSLSLSCPSFYVPSSVNNVNMIIREAHPQGLTDILTAPFASARRAYQTLRDIDESRVVNNVNSAALSLSVAADSVSTFSEKINQMWEVTKDKLESAASGVSLIVPAILAKMGIHMYRFITSIDWFNRTLVLFEIFVDFFIDKNLITSLWHDLMRQVVNDSTRVQVVDGDRNVAHAQSGVAGVSSVHSFLSALVSIGGAVVLGKVPDKSETNKAFKRFGAQMNEMSRIGNGLRSMQWMFSQAVSLVQNVIGFFFDYKHPDVVAMETLEKCCSGISEWAQKVHKLSDEQNNMRFSYDEELREEVFHLMDSGFDFYDKLKNLKTLPPINHVMFMSAFRSCEKLVRTVEKVPLNLPFRVDPFCVWMYGKPGARKSYLISRLVEACAVDQKISRYHRLYSRATDEAYFSGYTGQFAVFFDDFGQSRDTTKCNPWAELIVLKSNGAKQVQMAAVEEKGRPFTSQMIVVTSNLLYPKPIEIACHEALWRRRNILVEVESEIDVTSTPTAPDDLSGLTFKVLHPSVPNSVLEVFNSFEEFLMYTRVKCRVYLDIQKSLVAEHTKFCDSIMPLDKIPKITAEYCNAVLADRSKLDTLLRTYRVHHEEFMREKEGKEVLQLTPEQVHDDIIQLPAKEQALEYACFPSFIEPPTSKNLPIGDILCTLSRIVWEDYKIKDTLGDYRIAMFIQWLTNYHVTDKADREALIKTARQRGVNAVVQWRQDYLDNNWYPFWCPYSCRDYLLDKMTTPNIRSWIYDDFSSLFYVPRQSTIELMQMFLIDYDRSYSYLLCYPLLRMVAEAYFLQVLGMSPYDSSFRDVLTIRHPNRYVWLNEQCYERKFGACIHSVWIPSCASFIKMGLDPRTACFVNSMTLQELDRIIHRRKWQFVPELGQYMWCEDELRSLKDLCKDAIWDTILERNICYESLPATGEIALNSCTCDYAYNERFTYLERRRVPFVGCDGMHPAKYEEVMHQYIEAKMRSYRVNRCLAGDVGDSHLSRLFNRYLANGLKRSDAYKRVQQYRDHHPELFNYQQEIVQLGWDHMAFDQQPFQWNDLIPQPPEPGEPFDAHAQGLLELTSGVLVGSLAGLTVANTVHYQRLKYRVQQLKKLSNVPFEKDLKFEAGDIIEFDRGDYLHYAIARDNVYVVHLVSDGKDRAVAAMDNFKDVVSEGGARVHNFDSYAFVNNYSVRPNLPTLIHTKVGSVYHYNLMTCNCEHFVTWLRYGVAFSFQAKLARGTFIASTLSRACEKLPQTIHAKAQMMSDSDYSDTEPDVTVIPWDSTCVFRSDGYEKVMFESVQRHLKLGLWIKYIRDNYGRTDDQAKEEIKALCRKFVNDTDGGMFCMDSSFRELMTQLAFYCDELGIKTFDRGDARWTLSKLDDVVTGEIHNRVPAPVHVSYWSTLKTSLKQKIAKFYEDHPYLSKIFTALAVCGVVVGAYGLYSWISPSPKIQDEDKLAEQNVCEVSLDHQHHIDFPELGLMNCGHVDNTGRPLQAQNKFYSNEGRRAASQKPNRVVRVLKKGAPQDFDSNLNDLITHKVRRDAYLLQDPKTGRVVNALGVKGKLLLCNYHFFYKLAPGTLLSLRRPGPKGQVEFAEMFDSKKLQRLENTDVCMYECNAAFPSNKDISDKFVTIEDLQYFDRVQVQTFGYDHLLNPLMYTGFADTLDYLGEEYSIFGNEPERKTIIRKGFVMRANTPDGYCGSGFYGLGFPHGRKILGIHTATYGSAPLAICSLVTKEQLDELISRFRPQVVDAFDEDPEYQRLCIEKDAWPQMAEMEGCNFTTEGKFNVKIGSTRKLLHKPSLLQEFLPYEVTKRPSVLWEGDSRIDPELKEQGFHLMAKGVAKYGKVSIPFPMHDIYAARDDIQQHFNLFQYDMKPRVLTEFEAINGIPGLEYYDRLDMKTSPGYPYVKDRPPGEVGKQFLFEQLACGNWKVKSKLLRQRLDRRLKLAKQGKTMFSVWTNSPKAELRPLKKIWDANTRVFCMAPVDFTILCRQYFLAFCAAFCKNKNNFFSSVGINPDGPEWTRLYERHRSKGEFSFDEDFKNYDGTAMAEAMGIFCDIVNEWYNDGEENALIRRVLMEEIIHTRSFLESFILQKHTGVPSGTNITAIINTFIHALYIRCVYLIAMRRGKRFDLANLKTFNQRVADSCFGDDGFITSSEEILRYFNRQSVAAIYREFGITCTDAKKTGVLSRYESLTSIVFLKRHFAPHPDFPDKMLAPIDPDTIFSLVQWVTQTNDPEEQLKMNIEDSLRFAYHYGSKFYNAFRDQVAIALKRVQVPHIMAAWEEYDDLWLNEWIGLRDRKNEI